MFEFDFERLTVIKQEAGLIAVLQETGESQVKSSGCQHQSSYKQVDICFHLFPPLIDKNKVNENSHNTANNSGKKISIGYVPFNHDSLLINSIEIRKNTSVISMDRPNRYMKSKIVGGLTRRGEITPAANQATEMLPIISDALPNWPDENFTIGEIIT